MMRKGLWRGSLFKMVQQESRHVIRFSLKWAVVAAIVALARSGQAQVNQGAAPAGVTFGSPVIVSDTLIASPLTVEQQTGTSSSGYRPATKAVFLFEQRQKKPTLVFTTQSGLITSGHAPEGTLQWIDDWVSEARTLWTWSAAQSTAVKRQTIPLTSGFSNGDTGLLVRDLAFVGPGMLMANVYFEPIPSGGEAMMGFVLGEGAMYKYRRLKGKKDPKPMCLLYHLGEKRVSGKVEQLAGSEYELDWSTVLDGENSVVALWGETEVAIYDGRTQKIVKTLPQPAKGWYHLSGNSKDGVLCTCVGEGLPQGEVGIWGLGYERSGDASSVSFKQCMDFPGEFSGVRWAKADNNVLFLYEARQDSFSLVLKGENGQPPQRLRVDGLGMEVKFLELADASFSSDSLCVDQRGRTVVAWTMRKMKTWEITSGSIIERDCWDLNDAELWTEIQRQLTEKGIAIAKE